MKKFLIFNSILSFCNFFNIFYASAVNLEKGKEIFLNNCIACHSQGINIILPEKNLKIEALKANGMNNVESISYQIRNGKNGMPAFGGRLNEMEIENLAFYVLEASQNNFK